MICMILVPFWSPASVCNREPVCSLLELTNRYERRELSNIALYVVLAQQTNVSGLVTSQ